MELWSYFRANLLQIISFHFQNKNNEDNEEFSNLEKGN